MIWFFLILAATSTEFLLQVLALNNIHHEMTADELRNIFHVEKHDEVPQYEVVGVEAWSEGSGAVRLRAFGRDINLKLSQVPQLLSPKAPIFEASTNSSGHLDYKLLEAAPTDEHVGDTYQDEENQAALLIRRGEDGSMLMEGTIGHDLVLKPVPKKVKDRISNAIADSSWDSVGSHFVIRRNMTEREPLSDYAFMEPDGLPEKYRLGKLRTKRSGGGRRKREAPYVIYPEILVIVDYDGYRLHGGDNVQLKRYFVSFWNGVDLRYKLLKAPRVRISIAGIIISRGRDATPYLERNRVGRDAIDSAAALTDMGKYLFRERRLPVYDIAVAITKYDMCRRRKGGRCTKGTAGFAYVGGACVVNKRLEKVNSVAIIEDTGGFSGIIVAAHEVGHLLGAVHDGSPPPSYLGGPGAESCRWEEGYIMSDLRHTEKGFRWSPCSVASFHHFLNGDTATCLYNSPHEDESLPRVLPGKLLSLDAQCRRDRGTSACFKDDRVCAQLFCFDAGSGYCVAYRPAAEGSPCGEAQYCSNGRCIPEHENIIPDYTSGTPSYIRRNDALGSGTQARPVYADPPNSTRRLDNRLGTTPLTPVSTTRTTTKIHSEGKVLSGFYITKSPLESYKTPTYSIPSNSLDYHVTSTTSKPRRAGDTESCSDLLPGGGCHELATKYTAQYCSTAYFAAKCCAARKYICP